MGSTPQRMADTWGHSGHGTAQHGTKWHGKTWHRAPRPPPYRRGGRRVQADDAASVGAGSVDGSVQAEGAGVGGEAGVALLHHVPQHVHLDLQWGYGGSEPVTSLSPPLNPPPGGWGHTHQAGRRHLAARQPLRGHQEMLLLLAHPQLHREKKGTQGNKIKNNNKEECILHGEVGAHRDGGVPQLRPAVEVKQAMDAAHFAAHQPLALGQGRRIGAMQVVDGRHGGQPWARTAGDKGTMSFVFFSPTPSTISQLFYKKRRPLGSVFFAEIPQTK